MRSCNSWKLSSSNYNFPWPLCCVWSGPRTESSVILNERRQRTYCRSDTCTPWKSSRNFAKNVAKKSGCQLTVGTTGMHLATRPKASKASPQNDSRIVLTAARGSPQNQTGFGLNGGYEQGMAKKEVSDPLAYWRRISLRTLLENPDAVEE